MGNANGADEPLYIADDPSEALATFLRLVHERKVTRAVVIAEHSGDEMHVTGLNANPTACAEMLAIAAQGLEHVPSAQKETDNGTLRVNVDVLSPVEKNEATKYVNTLAAEWASCEADACGADIPATSRNVMRTMFYVGATSMFTLLMNSANHPDVEVSAKNLDRIGEWHSELTRFAESLRSERG